MRKGKSVKVDKRQLLYKCRTYHTTNNSKPLLQYRVEWSEKVTVLTMDLHGYGLDILYTISDSEQ